MCTCYAHIGEMHKDAHLQVLANLNHHAFILHSPNCGCLRSYGCARGWWNENEHSFLQSGRLPKP